MRTPGTQYVLMLCDTLATPISYERREYLPDTCSQSVPLTQTYGESKSANLSQSQADVSTVSIRVLDVKESFNHSSVEALV